jgi:hypothetical protein
MLLDGSNATTYKTFILKKKRKEKENKLEFEPAS